MTIRPGNASNADCSYESDYIPWMYTCETRNTSSASLKAGGRYSIISRHKWRLTFDDDSQVEFWLYKHAARMQDGGDVEFGMELAENMRSTSKSSSSCVKNSRASSPASRSSSVTRQRPRGLRDTRVSTPR